MPGIQRCRYCDSGIEYLDLEIITNIEGIREGTCNLNGEDDEILNEQENETNEERIYRCPECARRMDVDDDIYEYNEEDDDYEDDNNDEYNNDDMQNDIGENGRIIDKIKDIELKIIECPKCKKNNILPQDREEEVIFCSNNNCNEEIYLK